MELIWNNIGIKNWDDTQTIAARIPGDAYGESYVVCEPGLSGWSIVTLLSKEYVDKLNSGRVQLHVQFKNPNYGKKFLKSNVSVDRVKAIAEEFIQQYIPFAK